MRFWQLGVAAVLIVFLAASIPGLYYYTELGARLVSSDVKRPSQSPASSIRNYDFKSFDEVSRPDDPSPTSLPRTTFSLSKIQGDEKRRARRQLRVDINKAGKERLTVLNGVGPATAEDIINYRNKNGPIQSVSELDKIRGIGPVTTEKIGSRILIDGEIPQGMTHDNGKTVPGAPSKISINSASKDELKKLKGIGSEIAEAILSFRERHGPIKSAGELTRIDGIGTVTAERLRKSVTF